jgi:hypothetical protein
VTAAQPFGAVASERPNTKRQNPESQPGGLLDEKPNKHPHDSAGNRAHNAQGEIAFSGRLRGFGCQGPDPAAGSQGMWRDRRRSDCWRRSGLATGCANAEFRLLGGKRRWGWWRGCSNLARKAFLKDNVGLRGSVQSAEGTVYREWHPAIDGFDVEFKLLSAITLNLDFEHSFPGTTF